MRVTKYVIDGQEWTISEKYGSNGSGPYFRGYTYINGQRIPRYFGKVDPRIGAPCVQREYSTASKPRIATPRVRQNQIATYDITYRQICALAEYHGLSLKSMVAKLAGEAYRKLPKREDQQAS